MKRPKPDWRLDPSATRKVGGLPPLIRESTIRKVGIAMVLTGVVLVAAYAAVVTLLP